MNCSAVHGRTVPFRLYSFQPSSSFLNFCIHLSLYMMQIVHSEFFNQISSATFLISQPIYRLSIRAFFVVGVNGGHTHVLYSLVRAFEFEPKTVLLVCGVAIAPLVVLTFLALGGKLLSQLFLFRFFIPFYLFLLCFLGILLFTFHYTRHKSHLQINNKHPS